MSAGAAKSIGNGSVFHCGVVLLYEHVSLSLFVYHRQCTNIVMLVLNYSNTNFKHMRAAIFKNIRDTSEKIDTCRLKMKAVEMFLFCLRNAVVGGCVKQKSQMKYTQAKQNPRADPTGLEKIKKSSCE